MKRTIFTVLLLAFNGIIFGINVSAEENSGRIAITETNFPSAYVREVLHSHYDLNGDGYLKGYEIDKIKQVERLIVNPETVFEEDNMVLNTNNKYSVIDCTGLDIFENVKELYIYVAQDGKDYGVKNLDTLYKLKKVNKLVIKGNTRVKSYKFSNFPQLKYLEMDSIKNVDKITFGGMSKINTICLRNVSGKVNLDLSRVKRLKKFEATNYNFKGIKFGKNKKLSTIEMSYYSGESNKTIKNINVSGVKNLEYLSLSGMKKLKMLKIGKLNRLKEIFVVSGKVKNVDISKCNKLKKATLAQMGIKKLKIGEKQKIKYLDIFSNKINNPNLKNKYIKYLNISYNPIKIDLKNFPKLSKLTISKKMKILNKGGQKIVFSRYGKNGILKSNKNK